MNRDIRSFFRSTQQKLTQKVQPKYSENSPTPTKWKKSKNTNKKNLYNTLKNKNLEVLGNSFADDDNLITKEAKR